MSDMESVFESSFSVDLNKKDQNQFLKSRNALQIKKNTIMREQSER